MATIPGRDPALRGEYVIVGAHYDHLGHGNRSSSLGNVGEIHNGADDNASGSVALIEIARQLAGKPPGRSVVLVAFSGEELGLLGSAAYVRSPAVPMDKTVAMVNLDMVGRLKNDRLLVFGSETATEFPVLLDSLNAGPKFDLKYSGDGFGRSDQQSFYLAKKPVLHVFTDLHEDYHRPTDDWEKLNLAGLEKVATYATSIVGPSRIAPRRSVSCSRRRRPSQWWATNQAGLLPSGRFLIWPPGVRGSGSRGFGPTVPRIGPGFGKATFWKALGRSTLPICRA